MQITLRQFEYFLALAETGQVSKAALRCNVSQSSVTVALRNMQQTLDIPLFVRHAKGLRLTDAGERFVQHARNVVGAASRAIEDMQSTPSDIQGQLNIGVTETISAYLMPRLLSTVEQRFPGLCVQVVERERHDVERALIRGELDLALLLVSNMKQSEELEYRTLIRSTRRLWLHPDHPLQKLPSVSLADVARFDYVLLDMDEHVQTMEKVWQERQIQPDIRFQSRSIEAIRSLVAFQNGVAVLSDLVYRPWSLEGRRILRRDISDVVPTMDVGLVWRKNAQGDQGRQAVLDFLHSIIPTLTSGVQLDA